MSEARAYIVTGPESSGTRMLTGFLMAAGCAGSAGHVQRWDSAPPRAEEHPRVVWRRSVPHAEEWPDLVGLRNALADGGYEWAIALVTVRDRFCLERSQIAQGHVVSVEAAGANIERSYRHIFAALAAMPGVPYVMVPYESLILHGARATGALLEHVGLSGPREAAAARDENAKYYGGLS